MRSACLLAVILSAFHLANSCAQTLVDADFSQGDLPSLGWKA